MGSSIAYFLASNSDYDGSIAVVEKDFTYSACATTRSVGSIRQQFSTPENVLISQFGYEFLSNADEFLKVGDDSPDISLFRSAYLLLATHAGQDELRRGHDVQTGCGTQVEYLDAASLARTFHWLNVEDLAAGCRGLQGEGWFDPYSLLIALKKKAISLGVRYIEDEVMHVHLKSNRITGADLKSYGHLRCKSIVNAAGPYAGDLALQAGISLPVSPRRRNVFVFHSRARIEDMPLLVDPAGFYVRPEGEYYLCGYSPSNHEEDPIDYTLDVDHELFDDLIWPKLAHRIPQFETLRVVNSWAGHYDYNSFDQNGIVGVHPEFSNYYFANGFSGHGLQQAPAIGRAISELVVDGQYKSLDLTRLGYERILAEKKYGESVII